ncbi:MAG: guanylate kinase [Clostridia bacterium]|nr:guanylate kinase [Clostridia bacterium]
MSDKGLLIILSGPSGCGKDTVINELMKRDRNVVVSISSTTRAKRENEIDGVNYNFLTKSEFEELISNDKVLEYAEYNGCYYGTPIGPIDKMLSEGKDVILKIEVQGAQKVMKKLGDEVVSIFLLPPSFEELERRLRGRNSDTQEQIDSRLKIACDELKRAPYYDYVVVNDDLSVAVEDILSVFKAEKRKTKRNTKVIREVCKNA